MPVITLDEAMQDKIFKALRPLIKSLRDIDDAIITDVDNYHAMNEANHRGLLVSDMLAEIFYKQYIVDSCEDLDNIIYDFTERINEVYAWRKANQDEWAREFNIQLPARWDI